MAVGALFLSACADRASPTGERAALSEAETAEVENAPDVAVGKLSDDMVGQTVAVQGRVEKQCPAIGCWIVVKDKTGEVFVDLKPAGLELSESREGQRVRVAGRVFEQAGQWKLAAQALEFESGE